MRRRVRLHPTIDSGQYLTNKSANARQSYFLFDLSDGGPYSAKRTHSVERVFTDRVEEDIMRFLDILGRVTKGAQAVAPLVVPAINPAAGVITQLVLNAVVRAEETGGSGSTKKEAVMREVLPVVTPLLTTLLATSGKNVNLNAGGVNEAVSEIVEGVVKLLKAVEMPATVTATQ